MISKEEASGMPNSWDRGFGVTGHGPLGDGVFCRSMDCTTCPSRREAWRREQPGLVSEFIGDAKADPTAPFFGHPLDYVAPSKFNPSDLFGLKAKVSTDDLRKRVEALQAELERAQLEAEVRRLEAEIKRLRMGSGLK